MDEKYRAEGEAIYLRIAIHFEFDYVDENLAVMRDHSYNIGKDAYIMYDEVRRYFEDFFANDETPEYLKKLRSATMERLHRVKGMQFIGEKRDFDKGRECLHSAIREKPTLMMRPKFVGALAVAHLPESIANKMLDLLGKPPKLPTQIP